MTDNHNDGGIFLAIGFGVMVFVLMSIWASQLELPV